MPAISPNRLSELIGAIYDCAVDPHLWPDAMREICTDLRCAVGAINVIDLQPHRLRFVKTWNYDISRSETYADDLAFIQLQSPAMNQPIDEPVATSRCVSYDDVSNTRFFRKFHCRVVSLIRFKRSCSAIRNVSASFPQSGTRPSVGRATDDDLDLLRVLAPHIRRAITISDLMDLKTLEASMLSATLDRLATGVVVVADDYRVLYANEAAREMFSDGGPIVSRKGRLSVRGATADEELSRAIDTARQNEATMGPIGIGVSLGSAAAEPSLAHVLPLARGDLRTRLVPQAAAAVFVTAPQTRSALDFSALARTYGLTPAELRMCERLTEGHTLNEAAAHLGISVTTAKTHLARIFSKVGVTRQTDLVALIHRIAPPIRPTRA